MVNTVGGAKMVPNRSITDAMHFKQDVVAVQTGGKITLSRQDEGSRTRSRSSSGARCRRNLRQMDACFGKGPCDELAIAHGAINPDTGEEQDPTTPLVNVGKDGFNTAG